MPPNARWPIPVASWTAARPRASAPWTPGRRPTAAAVASGWIGRSPAATIFWRMRPRGRGGTNERSESMHKAKEREKMIGLIINAKRTDPETGSFTEWLADYLLDHGVTVPADDVPEALPENRRPAPPIGRCKDCAHSSP